MSKSQLDSRIILRNDTKTAFNASSIILRKGEPAIEIGSDGVAKFKFGDGINTYYNLPYSTLTPDVIITLVENNKGGIEISDTQPSFACTWFQPVDYQNLYTFRPDAVYNYYAEVSNSPHIVTKSKLVEATLIEDE